MATEPGDTPQGIVALAFARALVGNDFEAAHEMLAASLKAALPVSQLESDYHSMIEYGDEPPDIVAVVTVLDDWPDKQPDNIGWAYAAIGGAGYSEAVSVVVSQERGRSVVRSIEWGRP